MEYHPKYLEYFVHYRNEDFMACHEELEKLWHEDKNNFYKGLIQIATAFFKLEEGNGRGGYKLFSMAKKNLEPYEPEHLGLDVSAVLASLNKYIVELEGEEEGDFTYLIEQKHEYRFTDPKLAEQI